jgi:elongation factor Ts
MVTIEQVKKLRDETLVSVAECRRALETAGGDNDKAKEILKQWGKDLAKKKLDRQTSQGIIESYIHPNKKVGVLLELDCETDFVAKSQDFQKLSHELCLQVAAIGEDIPLLEQAWIKDNSKTIKDLIGEYVGKIGENVLIRRFVRYDVLS